MDPSKRRRQELEYMANSSRRAHNFNRGGRNFVGGRNDSFRGGFRSEGFRKDSNGNSNQKMPESTAHKQIVKNSVYGSRGTPVELVSNFYRVLHSDITVYHFDVAIEKIWKRQKSRTDSSATIADKGEANVNLEESEIQVLQDKYGSAVEKFIKKFSPQIFESFVSSVPNFLRDTTYVYDGSKSLYSVKMIGDISKEVEFKMDGKISSFLVTLKFVTDVSLSDAINYYNGKSSSPISERTISVIETIFRFVIGQSYAPYQRKFFDVQNIEKSAKVKLCDFVQGFINSVRMTEFGLALNVHLKTSCIVSKSYNQLIDFICDIINVPFRELQRGFRFTSKHFFEINKLIRHLKIVTTHSKNNVAYTIDSLVNTYPKDEKFPYKGKHTSIHDYFMAEYKLRLLDLPMIKCGGKSTIKLPLELCRLQEVQFLNKNKFDPNINRELLFKSTHSPTVYFSKASKIIKRIQEIDTNQTLKHFGIELMPNPALIMGRVLPSPRLISSTKREPFYLPSKSPDWTMFVLDDQCKSFELKNFADGMKRQAKNFGLMFPDPIALKVVNVRNINDIKCIFKNVNKMMKIDIIFIGIPSRHPSISSSEIYGVVKHCCDQMYGIMSQCFKSEVVHRTPPGYLETFLLKVNGKINGRNYAVHENEFNNLPFDTGRTMLVGVDVNHPGETERVFSSVAAAVATYDSKFTQYNTSIRVQKKEREEIVKELDNMLAELLDYYFEANKRYPQNIIIFRDGVSSGQFDQLVKIEIPLIERAIRKTKQKINLTLLVIQKRHHTRFALSEQDLSSFKPTYNVKSGTVVDRMIVDPTLKVFYLNSHFSQLGTSKPTKYIALRDDLKLSPDELQKFCFISCHHDIRTRNVISLPTPAKYADLCAYRAKLHIEAQRNFDDQSSIHSVESADYIRREVETIRNLNEKVKIHPELKNCLFFC